MDTEDAATAIFSFSDGTMGVLAASVSASIRWSGQIGIYGKRHFVVANVGFPDSIECSDMPVPEALRPRAEVSRRDRHEPHIRAVQRFVSGGSPDSQSLSAFAAVLRVVTQLYDAAQVIDVRRQREHEPSRDQRG
jgi:predicted dehydrogenase